MVGPCYAARHMHRVRSLAVPASLLALASVPACSGETPSEGTAASAAVVCPPPGEGPTRLAESELGTGFFRDAYVELGLDAARGRRVTLGDVNGDGLPDLVTIETGVTPGLQRLWIAEPQPDGTIRFVEVTERSGIHASRTAGTKQTALMVTFGDVDGDGDLDLFQGSYSQGSSGAKYVATPNELYLNDGKGNFTLKRDSGIDTVWPLTTTSAVFLDYDKDGKLDLFVGTFMKDYPQLASYPNELYRGNGDGTFTRVTDAAGLARPDAFGAASGRFPKPTYGATACDWDDDGWQDLLVSNYALMADELHRNVEGRFEDVSRRTKFAEDDQPNPDEPAFRQGGNSFAAACGDYDNDGDLDVFSVTTTHGDSPRNKADRSRLLVNGGPDLGFVFSRPDLAATGIDRPLRDGADEGDHGAAWLDFDNDGLLDLVIEQSAYPGNHAWLFHQQADHTFVDVTKASGVLAAMAMSNGLSVDDVDRDGDLDIVMGSVEANGVKPPGGAEHVHVFLNEVGSRNNFLHVTLRGTRANAQGIGARVTLTAGCVTQTREIIGGRGTFGATDPAYAHFGLGQVTKIDRIVVRWPTNPPEVQELTDVPVNRFVTITQGEKLPALEAPRR